MRMGLEQLLFLEIPAHAAVGETVALAGKHERALVNAILRRADRERDMLWVMAQTLPVSTRYSLPDFLVGKWQRHFGEAETLRLCQLIDRPVSLFVRRNVLAETATAPEGATALTDYPDFYSVQTIPREWLAAGHGYVQDPATWGAIKLLAPQAGEKVLDACAAPGGKSALIYQVCRGQIQLTATDMSVGRLKRLRENFARLLIKTAEVRQADWSQPAPVTQLYDAILLDVPCSNTGVIQKRVDVRWQLDQAKIKQLIELQRRIISNVIPHLAPGGRLVYSTCSMEPEENAQQVAWIENQFPQLQCEQTRFSAPHLTGYDGAYAARLRWRTQR
jgi:16S rRNA (cytosine967-C5)-methyltransferase